jgi:hypothetical protein
MEPAQQDEQCAAHNKSQKGDIQDHGYRLTTFSQISPFGEPLCGCILMSVNDPHGMRGSNRGGAKTGALHRADRQ